MCMCQASGFVGCSTRSVTVTVIVIQCIFSSSSSHDCLSTVRLEAVALNCADFEFQCNIF